MRCFLIFFLFNINIVTAAAQTSTQPIDHEENIKQAVQQFLLLITREDAIGLTGYLPEDTIYTAPGSATYRFWLRYNKYYFETVENEYSIEKRRHMRTFFQSVFNTIPPDFLSIHYTFHNLSISPDSTQAQAEYSIYFRDATSTEPNNWNTFPPIHIIFPVKYQNNTWVVTTLFDILVQLAAPLIGPIPTISPPQQIRVLPDVILSHEHPDSQSITIELEGEAPVFIDPDGDPLNYTLQASQNRLISATIEGSLLTLTRVPKQRGYAAFVITADDGHDGKAVAIFGIDAGSFTLSALLDSLQAPQMGHINLPVMNNDYVADFISANIISVTQSEQSDTIKVNPDNTIYYQPKQDFLGVDRFFYTIGTGKGFVSSAEVIVTINKKPLALADTIEIKPNGRINIDVVYNDLDNEGDSLIVISATQGTHSERVVINNNGTIHYRPLPNYEGEDQFSYTISDGNGGTATTHVFITVIDRAPFVNRRIPFQTIFLNEQGTIDLGGIQPIILDPQHEPLQLKATSEDSTIAIPLINVYQLSIIPKKTGRTTIQITGTDSIGQSASTSFVLIVKDPRPEIGETTPNTLFIAFEKSFKSRDLVALTGPVGIDTLGRQNQGHTYLSSLSKKIPENKILALRQNYDQLKVWQLISNVDLEIQLVSIEEQIETAQISVELSFEIDGRSDSRNEAFANLPNVPFSLQVIKFSSGWVIDNFPEFLDIAIHAVGGDQWTKTNWHMPDLILSQNSSSITLNLNEEPRLFHGPNKNEITYVARFITNIQSIEATIQDTLFKIKPLSPGKNDLTITSSNTTNFSAVQHFVVQINLESPITVSDTARVIQGESVDIEVLNNDHSLANETLHIMSTTQGAKSDNIQTLNNTLIRYTPKPNATGTDRFTYRIDDGKGNVADGFVFMFIQAKPITPDFNTDGQVDFSDFVLFAAAFGSNDPNYDLDSDGKVAFPDFIIFGRAFGN